MRKSIGYLLSISLIISWTVFPQENTGEIKAVKEELKQLKEKLNALENEYSQDKQKKNETISQEEKKSLIEEILERIRIESSKPTKEQQSLLTIYDDGYVFKGKDDTFRIGGWIQSDFRILEPGHPGDTTFTIRRARLDLRGSLENDFGYRVYCGFDGGRVGLVEGWVSYDRFPFARLKVGQLKEPFSLEGIASARLLDCIERSIVASSFSPAEDVGAMLFGNLFEKKLTYAIGVFNGRGRPPAIVPDEDNNDDSDVAARLELNPFAGDKESWWIKDLYIGAAVTIGNQEENFTGNTFRTAPRTIFLQYTNNVRMDGERNRFEVDMEWILGPVSIKVEWMMTRFEELFIGNKARTFNADFYGWYVTGTFFISGDEKLRNKPVVPKIKFNPVADEWGWGAWEIVARYDQFKAERELITRSFATGTDRVDTVTVGLNWWANHHIKFAFNYVYSSFDDDLTIGGNRLDHESAFLLRLQANF